VVPSASCPSSSMVSSSTWTVVGARSPIGSGRPAGSAVMSVAVRGPVTAAGTASGAAATVAAVPPPPPTSSEATTESATAATSSAIARPPLVGGAGGAAQPGDRPRLGGWSSAGTGWWTWIPPSGQAGDVASATKLSVTSSRFGCGGGTCQGRRSHDPMTSVGPGSSGPVGSGHVVPWQRQRAWRSRSSTRSARWASSGAGPWGPASRRSWHATACRSPSWRSTTPRWSGGGSGSRGRSSGRCSASGSRPPNATRSSAVSPGPRASTRSVTATSSSRPSPRSWR
jgi:hypothetical protein